MFVRLLASERPLAIEKFRHAHNRNYKKYSKVPRELRLCRMCASQVETPEHALLLCTGNDDLQVLRDDFFACIAPEWAELKGTA